MVAPLGLMLGAGLLATGRQFAQGYVDDAARIRKMQREQRRQDELMRAFGRSGGFVGIGGDLDSGDVLATDLGEGRGLMADPSDPNRQLYFAQDLLGMEGLENIGGSFLNNIYAMDQRNREAMAGRQEIMLQQQLDAQARISAGEDDLRGEWQDNMAEFAGLQNAYGQAMQSAQSDNPYAGISNIYQFLKMLDPRSVVNTGEGQMVTAAGGITQSMANRFNQLLGGSLDPGARQQLADEITRLYNVRAQTAALQAQQMQELAARRGLDIRNITTGLGISDTDQRESPAITLRRLQEQEARKRGEDPQALQQSQADRRGLVIDDGRATPAPLSGARRRARRESRSGR